MSTQTINISLTPNGGHTVVVIDGDYIGIDPKANTGLKMVNNPPSRHWYTVTIYGAPGNSCAYKITAGAKVIISATIDLADDATVNSTLQIFFNL